ncbi:MAG: hypothetical protein EXS35_09545 [Pedosphaera sp.]|nr:hypothetical protein [Pedosphaera sp.]
MLSRPVVTILFALAAVATAPLAAQTPVWSQFPNAPSGTSPRFDDLSFINESTGWVARATGGIWKTTNGGNSFTLSRSSTVSNLTAHFRSIGFVSESRGWAGNLGPGSYDGSVTDTNLMYETFDGGSNWTAKAGFPVSGSNGLCAIHALDSQNIFGAGRVRGPNAYFFKSTDGGTNWSATNLTAAGLMGGLMDVYFKDPTNGFVVGMDNNTFAEFCGSVYHGAIARTTNGGATWQVVATTTNSCCYFWKMSWPSPNIGYVSLQQNGAMIGHTYYKTVDGGATWTPYVIPFSSIAGGMSSFYWQGVAFVNDNEGWAGGDSASGLNNFLRTTNGGASWTPIGSADTLRINRIRFLRPDYAVASGARVAVYRVPLAITAPPTNTTVALGSNATFTVTAQGSTTLAYQWRFNVTNVAGANTSSFSLANVQLTNAGNYDVIVGDISGSLTSAVATLTLSGFPVAPTLTAQPQSQTVNPGADATFTVGATGTAPLSWQWRFNGTNLSSATNSTYTRTNVQPADLGNYSAIVTNVAGSVTSAVAVLTFPFSDDFDSYGSPSIVTTATTTNGYKIFFRAASGGMDFKAVFGFNYATVTYPTIIPPAPHSLGGTTKGLYLTVNKDTTAAAAAVNLYPVGQFNAGNFALKFDLWINYRDPLTSTEHALFGINHSGNVTNRIGQTPSDGLFFAVEGEADSSPTSTTLRDFSVFRGGGTGAIPFLMTTNNTTFGPTPPLAPQFDNGNPGLMSLFPAQTIPGYGTTTGGTAGLRWLSGEVRQVNNLITWILNGAAIAQYTNIFAYTNGQLLIGYNDNINSTGDSNNFAIFDNLRVEKIVLAPVTMLAPRVIGNNFSFDFATEPYESYTVQWATNLTSPSWVNFTNLAGNGNPNTMLVPLLNSAPQYFRVSRP